MFQDLFDTQEEIATGVKEGQVQSAWDRLPRSCADTLPLPDLARLSGYPIGLKNQGATCYLNSLLQIFFHTPQLRQTILDLPLCKGSTQEKSQFLSGQKHRFMLGFQRLFSQMSLKNTQSVSTEYLTSAFGWEGSEHIVQHDIEEAMKIIFDTFERALEGTEFQKNIKNLFKGTSSRYKTCKNCTVISERFQDFYGLNLQVQNYKSLQQSIMGLLTMQSMEGDNKIFCQTCQSKQDMWLGTKLKMLPNVLVLTLTRFSFDYEKFDRIKLTSFFSFNLQNNFSHLLQETQPNAGANQHAAQYQLYGVLIHIGSAHSGHYICYIRDTMQESDWQKGLQQAEKQEQLKKQKEEKQKQQMMTEQQKARKQQKKKQDKVYQLVEPNNKKLLQNWFELNDSRVTAIDANKITSKYEGSDSAYILFYRRKNLPVPQNIKVPEYFAKEIIASNQVLDKEREIYNIKKNQIILKIDGNEEVLNVDSKIKDILQIYCPHGFSLVNEAKHNGLPYYPKQLNSLKEYSDTDTVKSMDLIHESVWKKYCIDSDQYKQIQPYIEFSRMPFQLNIHYNQSNQKLIVYQDQTLTTLKLKLQQKYEIPYEHQIIKLVTAYREYFVTDELSNDDVLLTKLGFMHQCQVILKKLQSGQNVQEIKKIQEKIQSNTICFVIQRDDIHGIKKMYFDKGKTLRELLEFVVESQVLDKDVSRRFRNLNGDRLFYDQQYPKTLGSLNFDEQIVKLRIQRGEIPIKGDICVIAKMQSKFQVEGSPAQIEHIFDPNATIEEVKTKICEIANLKPEQHRLYLTDWMGQPARCVTREKLSIFDSKFGKEQKICIRDIQSPIGAQLISLEVYETKVGTPEDVKQPIAHVKIEEFKTLKDLKNEILKTKICEGIEGITIGKLRLRQIKKDYMFGSVMRDNNKQLKNYTFNCNKIVVQILKQQEQLTDSQIVLVLKKRNKEKRLYEGQQQLIFEAGKSPSIQDLTKAVHKRLELKEQEKVKIAKYIHYDFEWIEISQKYIDKFIKSKANAKANNTKNENKKEGKKGENKKQEKKKQQEKKEQVKPLQNDKPAQQVTQVIEKQADEVEVEKPKLQKEVQQIKEQKHQIEQESKKESKPVSDEVKNKDKNQKGNKNKKQHKGNQHKQKQGKQGKQGKQKQPKQKQEQKGKEQTKKQDCLNLRKAPYLLKDGDWIGYGLASQLEGDDLQTDEDLSLRVLKKNQKAVAKKHRGGPEKAFKVNLDF